MGLLSVLVMEVGRPVSATRLTELLWGDRVPSPATLRSHVSHLRRALDPDRADAGLLVTLGSGGGLGYQLNLPAEQADVGCFESGYVEGRRLLAAGAPERAVEMLGTALALWRGPAYTDVADQPFAVREVARLDSMRRSASRAYAEALSGSGRHAEAIDHLAGAIADQPYDEALRRLLALALYAEQRVAEAAQICRDGLRLLRERGIEAPELQQVQRAILRREAQFPAVITAPVTAASVLPGPVPAGPVPGESVAPGPVPGESVAPGPVPGGPPCLLPPDLARFVARTEEFERARRHLCDPTSAREALVVTGPAGVGKTTFAVRLAHAVASQFPDGQLYVNLRGFDPTGTASSPAEVLRCFLDALGVSPQRMPNTFEAQAGLYRSLLAHRRVLVVLDNAQDAGQVRPLLPGSPGCAVVVTSRNQMVGLAAADGADPLVLGLLTSAEARLLLQRRLGAARLATEPTAADEIVVACAGLPLALAVAAARARVNPTFPLRVLASQLRGVRVGLEPFASGDTDTDVRAVFSWSYRALADDAARLFRLLSLMPGSDITVPAAVGLANLPARRVGRLLAELCRLHLVTEHVPGRYALHDLLRAYATELAEAVDSPTDRSAARYRCLVGYLQTAHRAARLLDPHRDAAAAASGGTLAATEDLTGHAVAASEDLTGQAVAATEDLTDHAAALAWFTTEHQVLVGAVELAARTGLDTYAWQLAWALETFLDYRGHWPDWTRTQQTALASARRLGDRARQAAAYRSLGVVHIQMGRLDEGHRHLRDALHLYEEVGDPVGQAHTHRGLGWVYEQQGRSRDALDHNERALLLYRRAGHRAGQARVLNNIGWLHGLLGDRRKSVESCARAVSLNQEIGDRHAEAGAWDSLGMAHQHLGELPEAIASYELALELIRGFGDRYYEAWILDHLGDAYHAGRDPQRAGSTWRHALRIADELGHPAATDLRRKIEALRHVPVDRR